MSVDSRAGSRRTEHTERAERTERTEHERLRAFPLGLCVACVVYVVCATLAAPAVRAHGDHPLLPPSLLAEPVLVYPEDALREGVAGDVDLEVELDAAGVVQWVRVVSAPDPRLGWAALGAVTNVPFAPARHVGDDGVEHTSAVRFSYRLTFAIDATAPREVPPPSVALVGLHGRIVDAQGVGVAGASIRVEETGLTTEADAQGTFNLPGLAERRATLTVAAPGFETRSVAVEPLGEGHEHDDVVVVLSAAVSSMPVHTETTVSARRGAESAKRTLTQQVAVLDAEELSRARGRTLGSTLTQVPGVVTVQSGPGLEKPVVRGLFGRRVVMLLDGVRHEGQDWGVDHAPEIDPQAASRIEVVKGAAGVRYGPDALGGVVLLEPQPLRLQPGVDGELSLLGVDNGLRAAGGGRVDVVLDAIPSLSLRLEGNASRGAAQSAPDYVLGNTGVSTANLGATAQWTTTLAGQAASLKLSYRRFSTTQGICYCLDIRTPDELLRTTSTQEPLNAAQWTTSFDIDRPRQEVVHDTVLVRGASELGSWGRLKATYAFQLDDRAELDQVRRSVQGPQAHFRLFTHSLDVTVEHSAQRFGRFTLAGQGGVRGDLQEHVYAGLQLIPNYRRLVGGAWALERLTVADVGGLGDLELIVGARADQLAQTAFLSEAAFRTQVRRGRIDSDDCALTNDVARCAVALPAVSVTAGTRMHMDLGTWSDAVVVQADVSSAARFPDVDELYLGGRAPSFPVFGLGDAGLGTERTLQLSVGGAVTLPFVALDAGAFASRIDDYIAFGPERDEDGAPVVDVLITGAYPRFSSQAVDAMISGFDGGVVIAPGALLSAAAQVAVVQGLNLDTGRSLPFIPPPQARLELRAHVPDIDGPLPLRSTRLTTSALVVARQDRTDAASDFVPPPDGYTLWGATADTEVTVAQTPMRVGLEVRNLTNARFRNALSLTRFFADEVGREIWLRLEARFDVPTMRSAGRTGVPNAP